MSPEEVEDTGTRATCREPECGEPIYYSQARDREDPWVHRHWTTREYDHRAEPAVRQVTITVETYLDDAALRYRLRNGGSVGVSFGVIGRNS